MLLSCRSKLDVSRTSSKLTRRGTCLSLWQRCQLFIHRRKARVATLPVDVRLERIRTAESNAKSHADFLNCSGPTSIATSRLSTAPRAARACLISNSRRTDRFAVWRRFAPMSTIGRARHMCCCELRPPSTVKQVAFMKGHSSEIMNTAASAISSGEAMRPPGCSFIVSAFAAIGSGKPFQ